MVQDKDFQEHKNRGHENKRECRGAAGNALEIKQGEVKMREKKLRNRMNGKMNHKGNHRQNDFAEYLMSRLVAAVIALALIFGIMPVPAVCAEQTGSKPYVHDDTSTSQGEFVSQDSEEEIGTNNDDSEKSVTTPNVEKQQIRGGGVR